MDANLLMQEIYSISKQLEGAREVYHSLPFNNTEMLMMREIVVAKGEGRRLISSRLAEILDITRSAVSQIVNKLEAKKVVRRVPDAKDRKIAYIELTDEAYGAYAEIKRRINAVLENIIARFGEKRMENFLSEAHEFVSVFNSSVDAAKAASPSEAAAQA